MNAIKGSHPMPTNKTPKVFKKNPNTQIKTKKRNGSSVNTLKRKRNSLQNSLSKVTEWSTHDSTKLYGVDRWGQNFFNIHDNGHLFASPCKENQSHSVDMYKLTQDLLERGLRLPILVRFSDIVKSRIDLINTCFQKTINEYNYHGEYFGVFPIKVNQQKHLVEEIVKYGAEHHLGLECGSKPELLVTLAYMKTEKGLIICNGFKDMEYIETALLSQKLGRNTIIVIDRMEEIHLVIKAYKKLKIKPRIGLRTKVTKQVTGMWSDTTGSQSKFGLTSSEMVQSIQFLKEENLLDCLELLHFHMGSQIPSIQSIKDTVKEGARYYTALKKLAPSLKYIDVGGGLGIDYDGSGKSDSSTNYSEQEYANDIVSSIQSICDEQAIDHPHIISESGRALIAHSSVLIFDVLDKNSVTKKNISHKLSDSDSRLVKDLFEIYDNVKLSNLNESYNDLMEKKRDTLQLFTYGVLDLEQRARAEDLYWATATKISELALGHPELEDIFYDLEDELSDTYFCNFSVFQSLPDSWALGQVFPIMPLHRLNEKPSRRAVLADLTCDSDGKISKYIDTESDEPQNYLEVHEIEKSQPYYIAAFLTGAYQEILGDLHNLFGDTDAVHISVSEKGYSVDHWVKGDSVDEVLSYVEYHKPELLESVRKSAEASILNESITRAEARLLMKHYEDGLSGYTYFEN